MTGYVRPDVDELKGKELKLYRAYYCGICTALSNRYGPLSRLFLSYDATFMAIFFDAFSNERPKFGKSRCPLPPFQKKDVVIRNSAIEFGVETSRIGTRLKIEDSKRDSKAMKRFFFFLIAPLFQKVDDSLMKVIKPKIDKMVFLEITHSSDPNEIADVFGEALSSMVRWAKAPNETTLLLHLIGRWVYLIDALDDIKEDAKKFSYNPYILKYEHRFSQDDLLSVIDFVKENEESSIRFLLQRMQEEFLGLKEKMVRNSTLIENVIFYGIPKVTSIILNNECKKGE